MYSLIKDLKTFAIIGCHFKVSAHYTIIWIVYQS